MTSERGKIVLLPSAEDIDVEAALWFTHLRTGGLGQEEITAFEAWRKASDRQALAFEDLKASRRELGALEELNDLGRLVLDLDPKRIT